MSMQPIIPLSLSRSSSSSLVDSNKTPSATKRIPLQSLPVNQQHGGAELPVLEKPTKLDKPHDSVIGGGEHQTKSLVVCSCPVPINLLAVDKSDFDSSSENQSEELDLARIFHRRNSLQEQDDRSDMWTLKRANPVVDWDSEEEDELQLAFGSPAKRSRGATWQSRLDELDEYNEEEPTLTLSPGRHNARFLLE